MTDGNTYGGFPMFNKSRWSVVLVNHAQLRTKKRMVTVGRYYLRRVLEQRRFPSKRGARTLQCRRPGSDHHYWATFCIRFWTRRPLKPSADSSPCSGATFDKVEASLFSTYVQEPFGFRSSGNLSSEMNICRASVFPPSVPRKAFWLSRDSLHGHGRYVLGAKVPVSGEIRCLLIASTTVCVGSSVL